MSLSYMCVMLSHSLGSGANPGAFIPYVCSSFRSDRKGGKKTVVAMGWDKASYSVHPFEQSSKS